jgi:putative transposase
MGLRDRHFYHENFFPVLRGVPSRQKQIEKSPIFDRHFYHDKNIFFITITAHEWLHLFNVGDSMQILSESLNFCALKYKADILGYVLMPNHIHLIINFEEGMKRIDFMSDFKKFTSTKVRQEIEKYRPNFLEKLLYVKDNQVFKVWKDRYDEVYLDKRELLEIKLEYIHTNPIQNHWNLVARPEEYLYSSALFYEKGIQNLVKVTHYLDFV